MSVQGKENYKFVRTEETSSYYSFIDEETVRVKFFYPFIGAGKTFLDIGAAFGSYTLPAIARGCDSIIIINCPDSTMPLLRQNLEVNNFQSKIVEACAYSQNGYLNPFMRLFFPDISQIPLDYQNKIVRTMQDYEMARKFYGPRDPCDYFFPTITVDKALDNNEKVDFIKIDVEGAELEVIKGAENTIKNHKPSILIENHDFIDPNRKYEINKLILNEWGIDYKTVINEPYHQISHTLYR